MNGKLIIVRGFKTQAKGEVVDWADFKPQAFVCPFWPNPLIGMSFPTFS